MDESVGNGERENGREGEVETRGKGEVGERENFSLVLKRPFLRSIYHCDDFSNDLVT